MNLKLRRYKLAHQPINGLAVEHNISAIEAVAKTLAVFATDFEGEIGGQAKVRRCWLNPCWKLLEWSP